MKYLFLQTIEISPRNRNSTANSSSNDDINEGQTSYWLIQM